MVAQNFSAAIQDYVKEIYKLQGTSGRASTTDVARVLEVSPASASGMLKKLEELELVEREPYRGVRLTELGDRVAREVLRHHRLLEQYLAESLGLPIEQLHAEADRLEHALSEELEEHIDAALGFPTHDPHGDPIPDSELVIRHEPAQPLSGLAEGEEATVRRVPDEDSTLLQHLASIGIVPGGRLKVRRVEPVEGVLTLEIAGELTPISRDLAARIAVA